MWKLAVLFFFAVFGIYLGWFSPTEAAAMAAFAAIVIGFATRAMGVRGLVECADGDGVHHRGDLLHRDRAPRSSRASSWLTQFPNDLATWARDFGLAPFWILMAVMFLYVALGTFLDEVSTILITVPVTLPLILGIGYDGIWFGIFVTVMCTIGLISPPTGMTVFVIQAQHPEIPVMRIYMGTLPFLAADFVLVALLIFVPSIVLWLPNRCCISGAAILPQKAREIVGDVIDMGGISAFQLPVLAEHLAGALRHHQHRGHAERVRNARLRARSSNIAERDGSTPWRARKRS